jgi:phosphate starvation-inducible PhoH-like protein
MAYAISLLNSGSSKINKIVCMRPLITERNIEKELGALPGDVTEKVTPYSNGLIHNLTQVVGAPCAAALIAKGTVSFEAISLLRGSSFKNTFIIVDEAQLLRSGSGAMKLILTRIGENCRAAILGDVLQSPLEIEQSDMVDAMHTVGSIAEVGTIFLTEPEDVCRSPFVRKVLECYQELQKYQEIREKFNG